jgi:hypothetical protein
MDMDKIALCNGSTYLQSSRTLKVRWNAGCFSNLTVTLWGLEELHFLNAAVECIDYSEAFGLYRDGSNIDFHPLLLAKPDTSQPAPPRRWKQTKFNHHGFYHLVDFEFYNCFVRKFFTPSHYVTDAMTHIQARYLLSPERTIGVWYRGRDKSTEVKLAPPEAYLAQACKLLAELPDCMLWLQTDQAGVQKLFRREFGDQCIISEELPVSEGDKGVHLSGATPQNTVIVLAFAKLMANCKSLVLHTGNIASWICLYRDNCNNVVQFAKDGRLVSNYWQALGRYFHYRVIERQIAARSRRVDKPN